MVQRQQARQQRLLRAAQLPWAKALADYNHGGRIDAGRWQELEALSRQSEWLPRGENVLLVGPSGVGKTHLAIGIAMAQIGLDQPSASIPPQRWCRSCRRSAPTTTCRKLWSGWITTRCC